MTTRLPSILSQLSFPAYAGCTGLKIGFAQGSVEKTPNRKRYHNVFVHMFMSVSACLPAPEQQTVTIAAQRKHRRAARIQVFECFGFSGSDDGWRWSKCTHVCVVFIVCSVLVWEGQPTPYPSLMTLISMFCLWISKNVCLNKSSDNTSCWLAGQKQFNSQLYCLTLVNKLCA